MGYYTHLYGVDLDKLNTFCGSSGESELTALVAAKSDDLADLDERFESEIDNDDWPMAVDAVAEILTGNCIEDDQNAMYGYALEVICQFLGEKLNDDELGPLQNHPYDAILAKRRMPFGMPVDAFPLISHLRFDELPGEIELAETAKDVDDAELAEDIQIYINALGTASNQGTGVVSFYY